MLDLPVLRRTSVRPVRGTQKDSFGAVFFHLWSSVDYAVGLPCTSRGPVGTKLGVFEHALPSQWTGRHGQKPPEGHRGDKQGIYFIGFFLAFGSGSAGIVALISAVR